MVGPGGAVEKDFVLQFAKRLQTRSRLDVGIRVILTRESDEAVPLDRRASIANNNKADLFISLHANGSRRASTTGAQVLSLSRGDYRMAPAQRGAAICRSPSSAAAPAGSRFCHGTWPRPDSPRRRPLCEPFCNGHWNERTSRCSRAGAQELALRPLVGASMPAVLLELGFLTNRSEEKELGQTPASNARSSAILKLVADIRRGVPERVAASTP